MNILGINAYHGDASAAIVVDGQLVAAAEEERFNRIKHAAGFPAHAARYCLNVAGIKPGEVEHIAIARDPRARIWRKALYALRMPRLTLDRLGAHAKFANLKEELSRALGVDGQEIKAEIHRVEHHKAHLASSFLVSPFDEAALLSVDGLGDFASTMWGIGRGQNIAVAGAIAFPHSLGIYYTALTQYLGFWKYGDEYKVMGLGSYGEAEYQDRFHELVKLDGRLGFSLGLDYFVHHKTGPEMTWGDGEPILGKLYGDHLVSMLGSARRADEPIEQRHRNIAASLQGRLEDAMLAMLNQLHGLYGVKKLCLAGGVAYNCVANGKIFAKTPFELVYIQSAAGDAGLAIGSAFYVWHQVLGRPRSFEMKHSYWGPEFDDEVIGKALRAKGMKPGAGSRESEFRGQMSEVSRTVSAVTGHPSSVTIAELPDKELCRLTAAKIAEGRIVGWFQGRMEWGPRALGNRSIVADPRRADMKDILNSRIKYREPFRPFAPSVLAERVGDYFEETHPSHFMLMAYKVKPEKRSVIPAPTHVDGTGRLQTVTREENPLYWTLIKEFENLTGVPVLLNTSFNENEPVVCTPKEAVDCFLRTKMDVLAIGKYLVEKI
ncbi:MAG TPA: carbamoyltransferase C-terminal domain-containing protein [Candidatus Binatia bacterium]|nr:carbamoyltransferase C-terminal domain-containing protein [Candidatus Binatia bacterium]